MSRRGRLVTAMVAALALLLPAGCVRMPESGPVVETRSDGDLNAGQPMDFVPRPPQSGAAPADIVKGFLEAMTATPMEFTVAREFLSPDARASWNPELETVTYAEASTPRGGASGVTVTLTGAHRLDARGSWLGRVPPEGRIVQFPMARDADGEWRISVAPNALIVPETWFEQVFRQVSRYFFDPTAQILVPEPVFVPRGEQLATALTKSLLVGPGPGLSRVSRSFIPPGLEYGVSVPVSADGVADIALNGEVGQQTPQAVELMLAQFAWTLRQEPTIRSLRLSIGGQQVQLPGGVTEVGVGEGSEYDPTGFLASSLVHGLRDGRLVAGLPGALAPVDGPFGTTAYGVSSIAVNIDATTAAAVSGDGRSVLRGPVGADSGRVRQIVSGARDLLRPAWDFADRLWLVDRTPRGARVLVVEGDQPRLVDVPGITGRDVRSFVVSRDGSRLVAVVRQPGAVDSLRVSRIRHDTQGRVLGATRARAIGWDGDGNPPIRDLGWAGPTSLVALQVVAGDEIFSVRTISVDGSPPGIDGLANTLRGRVLGLVSSPVASETLYAVTASLLLDQTSTLRLNEPVESGVTSLGYVG